MGEKVWRCMDCGHEHPVIHHEIPDQGDECPNCKKITQHELIEETSKSNESK